MYKFIAFGHSHIVALAKGAYESEAANLPPGCPRAESRFIYLYDQAYAPILSGPPDASELNPKLRAQLAEVSWNFVILVCGGNEHNVLGIVRNKRPFDFVLSGEPDLPLQPGYELVPEGLIREALKTHMVETLQTMRAFRSATELPMVQLEPPPPLPNERVLAYPTEFRRALLFRKSLAPQLVRHKLWRLQSDLYRRFCDEIGVSYLRAPGNMIAESGMLAEPGWGMDATHANSHYGGEVLKDALQFYRAQVEQAQASS
jgi:hypothetical protein